jgi:hypothetical protein
VDPLGLFAYYGNWCGPNWTGGRKEQYDPSNVRLYKPPIDALDNACMRHDKCYYECRKKYPCDNKKRRKCMNDCDLSLAQLASESGHKYSSPLWWWMRHGVALGEANIGSCPSVCNSGSSVSTED